MNESSYELITDVEALAEKGLNIARVDLPDSGGSEAPLMAIHISWQINVFRHAMIKCSFYAALVATPFLVGCGAKAEEKPDVGSPQADETDKTAITQERADKLIGFTESDAESCAMSLGWAFRVGERYGESFVVAEDYSLQRVTVSGSVRSRPVTRVPIYKSLLMDRSGRAIPHPRPNTHRLVSGIYGT